MRGHDRSTPNAEGAEAPGRTASSANCATPMTIESALPARHPFAEIPPADAVLDQSYGPRTTIVFVQPQMPLTLADKLSATKQKLTNTHPPSKRFVGSVLIWK